MTLLILGLIVFLGAHSVRIFAEGWRGRVIARLGPQAWKGLYTLVSLAGLVLLCIGFGQARRDPVVLWSPPYWTHHLAGLFVFAAFVLVTAAYVPGNAIKARLRDPMILGVKSWAFGHLLANGTLADVVLFGSVLAWAILDFRAARLRRESGAEPAAAPPVVANRTALTLAVGFALWASFAFWLHGLVIGVRPFY
jgi:uncharacterized membrane protein